MPSDSVITHGELLLFVRTFYPGNAQLEGICFGFSKKKRDAVFAAEVPVFWDRLWRIKQEILPVLQEAAKEVENSGINSKTNPSEFYNQIRERVIHEFPYQKYLDIWAFFDGVLGHQNPAHYAYIFPPDIH